MKLLWTVVVVGVVLVGCSAEEKRAPANAATDAARPVAADPKALIAQGALVIDVRSEAEWNEGHLSMAKLLPLDQLPARIGDVADWNGGDKSKPIVLYCRSGNRSGQALAMLRDAGFTHVVNGGGYQSLR